MGEAWSSYEAARSESKFLPPLEIKTPEGVETFLFPADVSGEFGMALLEGRGMSPTEALKLIPELIGTKRAERLKKITTFTQLLAIVDDLLRQYGFSAQQTDEEADPLAQRPSDEPSASTEPSSTTSEPSRQTSPASTG